MHKLPTLARTVQLLSLTLLAGSFVSLQAQSLEVATAVELEGQVSVIRHGGQVALFQKGTPGVQLDLCTVSAKEEIVTGPDGHAVFQIRDGSTFEVFPNAQVTFQPQWDFEHLLEVLLGKVRVQVEHRNGPNHKRVETPTAVISVRGTVFDVNVEDVDGTTYIGVEEGQVLVHHLLQPSSDKILNQNEYIRVYPNQPLAVNAKPSRGVQAFVWQLERAFRDLVYSNPGGVLTGGNGGAIPGGPQADKGKTNKPAPPGPPPAAPGGGGNE